MIGAGPGDASRPGPGEGAAQARQPDQPCPGPGSGHLPALGRPAGDQGPTALAGKAVARVRGWSELRLVIPVRD